MFKHTGRLSAAVLAACMLMTQGAMAESVSFEGTVAAAEKYIVYAPIGGTVESVEVEVGERINAGDALAVLKTTKVYASESGTVTGVFGQTGDAAETVSERYGAVMYIEGDSRYTIAASTDKAYDTTENKFVHVGEQVYLLCYSDGDHTGTGVITAIEGTDYTVEVLTGEFEVGETVSVCRDPDYRSSSRIGRGTLSRRNPTAVTGSGSIVSYAVANGDAVKRGDLLFETLEGSFDGLYMSGSVLTADIAGTIGQINAEVGGKLEDDSALATIYPENLMRVEAQISEYNLGNIAEGDRVNVELLWNQDEEVVYPGTITMISAVANEGQEGQGEAEGDSDVTYMVYVEFTPDERTRIGMSAVVSTLGEDTEFGEAENEAEPVKEAEDDGE